MLAALLCSILAAQDPQPQPEPRLPSERQLFEQLRVAVSPTRTEAPAARAPSAVSVLSAEEIQRSGVRFLPDVLRLAPGVEVQRLSSTESNVSVRSYNDDSSASQGMLGLVDGRQVYNDFYGNVVWEALPVNPEDIRSIEVIRGPGSFLHGPNAMHGLVNITTKSPLEYEDHDFIASGRAGSYRSSMAMLTYVKRQDNVGVKATLGWDDIAEFDSDRNTQDKKFLELRAEARLDKAHRLELTTGTRRQKVNVLIPTFAGVPASEFRNDTDESFVKLNYAIGDLKMQVYWTGLDTASVPNQIYVPFELDLDTVDLDVQYSLAPFEHHAVTVGSGYRYSTYDTEDEDVSEGEHKANLGWLFVQDEVQLADSCWVTGGVRWDRHSTSGHNVSPRAALVWQVAPEQYLRLTAGTGFRNPSLREIWFEMPASVPGLPVPATITGNKELKAEQIRSFELAYTGRPLANVRAGCSLHYNLVDRLIEYVPVEFFPSPPFPPGTPSVLAPVNRNKDEAYGMELEVEYLFTDRISGFANYGYGIRQDRDTNKRNPLAPRHKANAGIKFTLPEGLSGMLWVHFFDDIDFFGARADEYALLNGRISYTAPVAKAALTAFVQAFNLLDHDHHEHPEGDSYGLILMGGLEIAW